MIKAFPKYFIVPYPASWIVTEVNTKSKSKTLIVQSNSGRYTILTKVISSERRTILAKAISLRRFAKINENNFFRTDYRTHEIHFFRKAY